MLQENLQSDGLEEIIEVDLSVPQKLGSGSGIEPKSGEERISIPRVSASVKQSKAKVLVAYCKNLLDTVAMAGDYNLAADCYKLLFGRLFKSEVSVVKEGVDND